jgi:hypothetical protein
MLGDGIDFKLTAVGVNDQRLDDMHTILSPESLDFAIFPWALTRSPHKAHGPGNVFIHDSLDVSP